MLHFGSIDPPLTPEEEATRPAWATRTGEAPQDVPDEVLRFMPLQPLPLSPEETEWARKVAQSIGAMA